MITPMTIQKYLERARKEFGPDHNSTKWIEKAADDFCRGKIDYKTAFRDAETWYLFTVNFIIKEDTVH